MKKELKYWQWLLIGISAFLLEKVMSAVGGIVGNMASSTLTLVSWIALFVGVMYTVRELVTKMKTPKDTEK